MRIVFFTHYFPPESNAPAARCHSLCKRWVRLGHEVTVVTCVPNCPAGKVYDGYRNRLFQREKIDGIDVWRVWTYLAANKGTFRRTLNYLSYMGSAVAASWFLRRPDVFIATSPQFFCGWGGVLAASFRRVPLIVEIRDLWPDSIRAVGAIRSRRVLRVLESLERGMYTAADRIVTVGQGYCDQLRSKGVHKERISIVPNGVDRELFFPRPEDVGLKAKLGLADKFICCYAGTIGMASGLDVVLRAAELLKSRQRLDIAVLLVGDGASREALQVEARQKGLDNVIFLGRQDRSRMPGYLSISDACLVHLKDDDVFATVMPSKIFEAAGMARPVILGVRGFARRLVEQAEAGICIDPEDAAGLVAAMEKLADDPDLARALGESGCRYVLAHHDREPLARQYAGILNRLVQARRRPAHRRFRWVSRRASLGDGRRRPTEEERKTVG